MPTDLAQTPNQTQPLGRRLLQLALLGTISLALGGCKIDFAGNICKREKADILHVGHGSSCKFNYGHSDIAKYNVIVTRAPYFGQASGQGPYLHYVSRPGYRGEDLLSIKVVRKGAGHVQWETYTIRVKVGLEGSTSSKT